MFSARGFSLSFDKCYALVYFSNVNETELFKCSKFEILMILKCFKGVRGLINKYHIAMVTVESYAE